MCPTLCDPMDCSPPGSSVHGILQARILKWVAMPSYRVSSWPRYQTHTSLCFLHGQVGSLPLCYLRSCNKIPHLNNIMASTAEMYCVTLLEPGSLRSRYQEDQFLLSTVKEASIVAQLVKNLPAMQMSWVWSLDWEDPLEKGKSTLSSILAWKIPWTI